MKININKAMILISQREGKTVSKREVAKRIGVHFQKLSELENGEAPKQIKYVHKLARLAGVPIDKLITDEMNHRLTIDKIEGGWYCSVTQYDTLPFNKFSDEVVGTIKAESYSELIQKMSENEVFDLINKNQNHEYL